MRQLKFILFITFFAFVTNASAKTIISSAYVFGFSASFNDSIVYFTEMQKMDSLFMDSKNKFVIGIDNFSAQMKHYLENQRDERTRTCIFFYALDKKKLDKRYAKLQKRYSKNGDFVVKYLKKEDFSFTPIDLSESITDNTGVAPQKKDKAKKGKKKSKKK